MKLKQLTACTLAVLTLMGCAHRAPPPSSYRFDYQVKQNAEGVIRAFDDGHQTIVQFVDLERAKPMFADQDGKALEYEVRGQYAVLSHIVPSLTVSTTAGAATFTYTGTPDAQATTASDAVPGMVTDKPTPARESVTNEADELARLRELIAQAKQQLADITRQLTDAQAKKAELDAAAVPPPATASAPAPAPAPVAETAAVQAPAAEPAVKTADAKQPEKPAVPVSEAAQVIRGYFPSIGTTMQQLDTKTAEQLLVAAMGADRVLITGHADASGNRAKNDAIALSRALSAKAYLVQQGIEDTKIATATKGDRAPIASNNTAEGRALNRRVDFTFERKDTPRKD